MSIILVKNPIDEKDQTTLLKEFPQFRLTFPSDIPTEDQSYLAEIVYSQKFSKRELDISPQVRWIHVPSPYTDEICLEEILAKGNILITTTKEENITQIGEYALSAILAFSKHLFIWKKGVKEANVERFANSMWRSENRTLLQIGLGFIGTEIAHRAHQFGFRVLGVRDPPSFHPHCNEVLSMKNLRSILPTADIVSLAMPRDYPVVSLFSKEEIHLLKEDSILMVFGNGAAIDLEALAKTADKLRGVLIDAHFKKQIPASSPLWKMAHVIFTPEVGMYPRSPGGGAFRTFLYNLRQFMHGNFRDMKNLLNFAAE